MKSSHLPTMELQFLLEGPRPCTILCVNVHTRRTFLISRPKMLTNKCITKTFVRFLIFQLTRFSLFFSKLVAALIVTGENEIYSLRLSPPQRPLRRFKVFSVVSSLAFLLNIKFFPQKTHCRSIHSSSCVLARWNHEKTMNIILF